MDVMERPISTIEPSVFARSRSLLIVAVLIVGLMAGFVVGRITGASTAPATWPVPTGMDAQGPGHVPRVWVRTP